MIPILAIAFKDLRLLFRDRGNCFFTFVFPVLFAVFFGMIFAGSGGSSGSEGEGPSGMKVAVWNEDGGARSKTLVEALRHDEVLRVRDPQTRAEAEGWLRRGEVSALVVVPKGFEQQAQGLFAGRSMQLETIVDPSQRAAAGMLQGKLMEKSFVVLREVFTDPKAVAAMLDQGRSALAGDSNTPMTQRLALGAMMNAVEGMTTSGALGALGGGASSAGDAGVFVPVLVTTRELGEETTSDAAQVHQGTRAKPRNSFEISLGQGIVWGLLGCITAFATSLATERSAGTMRRLSVAPIGATSLLLGKALACALACVLVQVLLLCVMMAMGARIDRPHVMSLVVVVNAIGFTGLMMLIAGLSASEGGVSGMGRGLTLVLAMIGGGTVPLFFLPSWVQTAASVSPFKWSTLAVEGATWRAMTMGELALPLAVLLGMAAAGFGFGVTGLQRMLRK